MSNRVIVTVAATMAAVALTASQPARAVVQTYSAASGAGGVGRDHPGFGFFQFDPGLFDSGLDAATTHPPAGEFAFTGSDGGFHMEVHALLNQGITGRTGDNAVFFEMNYDPNPPTSSFGTFWFGGVGNDIGSWPKVGGVPVPLSQVLVWADALAPAGKPMEFRTESTFTNTGNGFKFAFTGTGAWQTIGGVASAAVSYGAFNPNQTNPLASLVAFGQNGNEITAVDDGSDPNNVPTELVDNLCLTIASANWGSDASGNWGTDASWNISAPDGPNATAIFGNNITAPRTVNMDSQHFIGSIQFNSAQSYTISGSGLLSLRSLDSTTFASIPSSIDVVLGSHTISAPVELWGGVSVNVEQAASTLTISNLQPTFLAGAGVSKIGLGTLVVNNVRADSLAVHAGKVQMIAGAAPNNGAGTSVVKSLTIDAGASLDLTNNSMVIDYTGAVGTLVNDTRLKLQSGQLKSSSTGGGLGYADNAGLGMTTFAGQTVDLSSVLIKFTLLGDTNLDGNVNVSDLGNLATNFGTTTGATWTQGDFDYNGAVNVADLGDLATNFGQSLPAGSAAGEVTSASVAAVPEPAFIGLAVLGLLAIGQRKRNTARHV